MSRLDWAGDEALFRKSQTAFAAGARYVKHLTSCVQTGGRRVTKMYLTLKLFVFNNLCSFVLTPWTFESPLVMVRLIWLDECQPHRLPTPRAPGPLKRTWRVM